MVLERHEAQKQLLVSRKASLVSAAREGRLPTSFSAVREGALLPGYVAGVTADAVFVRFANHVTGEGRTMLVDGWMYYTWRIQKGLPVAKGSLSTHDSAALYHPRATYCPYCLPAGRAGLSQLADTFVTDPRALFAPGQSVRAQVVTLDADKQRFAVTLRPSLTASSDAAYVTGLYADLESAAAMKGGGDQDGCGDADWARVAPGRIIRGTVDSLNDYGLLIDVEGLPVRITEYLGVG